MAAKKGANWGAPGCDGAGADRAAEPAGSADIANFPGKDERYRFVAIDLTDLVKQWVAGQQANHGVLLKFVGGGCVKFYSNEFQDYPFRPELLLALDGGGSVQAATAAPEGEDLEAALAAAKKSGKPLAVKFYSPTCGVCKAVERGTFSDADVKKALGDKYQYVSVKIEDRAQLAQDLGVGSVPALVILQADGKTRTAILGSDVLKEKEKVLKALADPEHAGADAGGAGGCSARALVEWDQKLRARLAEATKGGKRLRAYLSPLGGKPEAVSVTGADEKVLRFEMKGNKLDLPWAKVAAPDRLALADALAQAGDGSGDLLAGVMLQCSGKSGEAENRFAQALAADPKLTREGIAELKKELKQP
jgi:thioredoxin-like negative regulator of GroEL